MNTKQELIKWMTEKRENLPFQSKVQLIKDFWDNRNAIKNFSQKFGKSSLEEVEQLIYKEREAVKKVITEKSNQITQLYKLFQGTAGIFQKQHNYVDKLKKNLEEEAKDKNLSQEKAKHLEEDIQRLDQQKKELEEKIKELEKGEKESKEIRDKELNELKEKVANLTAQLETVQKVDAEVYKVLEEYSTQKGLLLRSQEVAKKLKEAESKVLNKQELEVVSSITQFSTSAFFNIESILQTMTEVGNLWNESNILPNLKNVGWKYRKFLEHLRDLKIEFRKTKANLQKELTWWDKWFDDKDDIEEKPGIWRNKELFWFLKRKLDFPHSMQIICGRDASGHYNTFAPNSSGKMALDGRKLVFKLIHDYYLSK